MKKFKLFVFVCLCILIIIDGCKSKNARSAGVIKIDNIELPYIIEGTGQPCLFYGMSLYQTKSFSPNFRSHFQCIFVDSRFNVLNAIVDTLSPFTIDAAVDEIETIRKELNMPQFVLVGHSVIGLIALEYAKRYPNNVSHVIAIGTMPAVSNDWTISAEDYWNKNASSKRKELLESNLKRLNSDSLAKLAPSDAFISMIVANAPKRWYDSVYNEGLLLSGVPYNIPILNQLFSQDFFLFKDSSVIKPPVFLAMGKYDFDCPYIDWEKFLPMFNDINFQVFDYSGHDPQTEEADKFDSLVIKWIEKKK